MPQGLSKAFLGNAGALARRSGRRIPLLHAVGGAGYGAFPFDAAPGSHPLPGTTRYRAPPKQRSRSLSHIFPRLLSVNLLAALFLLSPHLYAYEEDSLGGLIKALKDENALVRKRAAVAIGRLGAQAKEALTALEK